MTKDEYVHDLQMVEIGDEYDPMEFTVTEEMADKHTQANDDYNTWQLENSPFGGCIAPPNLLIPKIIAMLYGHYKSIGVFHTK